MIFAVSRTRYGRHPSFTFVFAQTTDVNINMQLQLQLLRDGRFVLF
jgi:hypothetical protein